MKADLDNLTKRYYTMGEVASMFNVNTSLIRYWEKEFPSFNLQKSRSGIRRFTKDDVRQFGEIYRLIKEKGFTLEGAREAIKNRSDYAGKEEQLDALIAIRDKLNELANRIIE